MVPDEAEEAVLLAVGGLETVQVVAVGFCDVDGVLIDVADLEVVESEAVSPVNPDPDVLGVVGLHGPGGALIAQRRIAALNDDVVGAHTRPLDLQVAADAWPRVRDPVAVDGRRLRDLDVCYRPADHRDQVLVVGAGGLVLVGERPGRSVIVGLDQVRTGGIVSGGSTRLRLGVEARHDDYPVVVVCVVDSSLDRAVPAPSEELHVEGSESVSFHLAERDRWLRGPELVSVCPRVRNRCVESGNRWVRVRRRRRLLLRARDLGADHARVARGLGIEGGEQAADLGNRAARRRVDGGVRRRVGPVRGALDVCRGKCGDEHQGRGHTGRCRQETPLAAADVRAPT